MASRIAVDAMGGDHAPGVVVEGALQAVREFGHRIILVGREDDVRSELRRLGAAPGEAEVVHAPEVIEMHEPPVLALRRKKHSSIRIGAHLIREGRAEGFISAGNTGAVMAGSKVALGTIHGIDRPAVTAILPSVSGRSVWLDVGANVDCRPQHIKTFAIMGAIYSREILHVANPRVGLLSIGEEDTKGNELTKEVFKEMRGINLNFIGNVEGRDIFNGTCDVIVCDGFTGNVSLKAIESVAEMLMVFLRKELQSSLMARAGTMLAYPALRRFKRTIDYAEYGGFPLLGVKGSVIICHGRSSPKAIKNAIRACAEAIEAKVNDRIHEIMARETASLAPAEV